MKDRTGAGTAKYNRPPTPAEKAELERELEALRDGEDEAARLDLSPEEVARLEAAKKSLLAELKQDTEIAKSVPSVEAKPRRPGAPPTPAPADQGAPRFGLAEESIDTPSPLTLAVRARKLQEQMAAGQAYGRSEIDVKKAATAARLQPLVEKAKVTLAAVKELFRQHEEAITLLASSTWQDAPPEWSPELRLRAQTRVFVPAGKLLGQFRSFLAGIPKTVAEAERVISIGYWHDSSWPSTVTQAEWELGHQTKTDDIIASLTNDLKVLNQELERVEEFAKEFSGRTPEVVVTLMSGAERRGRVGEALERAKHGDLQTHGEGVSDPIE